MGLRRGEDEVWVGGEEKMRIGFDRIRIRVDSRQDVPSPFNGAGS